MLSVARRLEDAFATLWPVPAHDPDAELLAELFEAVGCGAASLPTAERLLDELGALAGVLAASAADLARLGVPQEARQVLATLRAAIVAALRRPVEQQPCLGSSRALVDYLHATMAYERIERFRVLFLDNRNMLIRDQVMSEGSVQSAPVHVREVVRRAIELGASALILVHNHTSGDPRPSRDDIELTAEMVAAARLFGMKVHDHIIIGRHGHASLSELGCMG